MNPLKNLLILFSLIMGVRANAQLQQTRHFHKQSEELSFCGQNFILDSLGYFFKERGCEGNGQVSFGRYKVLKNNIVVFQPLPFDSLQAIRQIRRTQATDSSDSTITITLYDRYNQPLTNNFNIDVVDTSGKTERIVTNKKGQIILNRNIHRDIVFISLLWLYEQSPSIVHGNEAAIEVYLGLPDIFLWQTEVTAIKEKQFKLMLKKDGVYKLDGKSILYSVLK